MEYQFWFQYFFKKGILGFCFLLLETFLIEIGETLPASVLEKSIHEKKELIIGQKLSYNTLDLKMAAIKIIDPNIITIGNSRMNYFRANMFKPYSYYNLSRTTSNINAYQDILKNLSELENLKVVFVIIEPYSFKGQQSSQEVIFSNENRNKNKLKKRFENLIKELKKNIFSYDYKFKDNFGIHGMVTNRGLRSLDGSAYGGKHHDFSVDKQIKRLKKLSNNLDQLSKKEMFKDLDCNINQETINTYLKLVEYGKSIGVTIIGITPPYSNQVNQAMNSDSEKYKLWQLFSSEENANNLKKGNGFYYNFIDLKSIEAPDYEMIDRFHPSEKICARMILKMMEDNNLKKILPLLDKQNIIERINSSPLPLGEIFTY